MMNFRVLDYARRQGLPFIFGSSREVYGDIHRHVTEEGAADFVVAESPYSASKIAGEAFIYSFSQCYHLPYLVFRFSNVYGRYDNDLERMERVLPLFIRRISRDEPVVIYGREKVFDFTYVDDCIDGICLGLDALVAGRVKDQTINLAYGQGGTLLDAVNIIALALGKRPKRHLRAGPTGRGDALRRRHLQGQASAWLQPAHTSIRWNPPDHRMGATARHACPLNRRAPSTRSDQKPTRISDTAPVLVSPLPPSFGTGPSPRHLLTRPRVRVWQWLLVRFAEAGREYSSGPWPKSRAGFQPVFSWAGSVSPGSRTLHASPATKSAARYNAAAELFQCRQTSIRGPYDSGQSSAKPVENPARCRRVAGRGFWPGAEVDKRLDASPRHHEWVDIKAHGGRTVRAFLVFPESSRPVPGILVIHENKGLTDWVRSVADQLAEAGYVALAPDLLSQTGPDKGGTDSYGSIDAATKGIYQLPPDQVTDDLDACAAHLKKLDAVNGKMGVAGFCWGGGQSFRYVAHNHDLLAAFVFYGPAPDAESLERIHAPVFGFYGGNDQRISGQVPNVQAALKKLGRRYEPVIYKGAGHGFMRTGEEPNADPANRDARKQAWERWKKLLKELDASAASKKSG